MAQKKNTIELSTEETMMVLNGLAALLEDEYRREEGMCGLAAVRALIEKVRGTADA